ncbi:MAG: hypothetical protein ACI8QC_001969 [Planctomycetota bacterium]|jgi:hypothetical protein
MDWNTLRCGAAGTLLILASGCASSTDASYGPNEIHISSAELATEGTCHQQLQPIQGDWQVTTRFWPKAKTRRARTSEGTVAFDWSADGGEMVGQLSVNMGEQNLSSCMVIGVDSSTDCYVMGWNTSDGSSILPRCLATEGSPADRMIIQRASGDGMVREIFSGLSADGFRYERYRSIADGTVYKDLEIVGTR